MKRFTENKGHSKVARHAITQMQAVRSRLNAQNPGLLRHVQQKIWGEAQIYENGEVPVDQQKNMEAIRKLAQLAPPHSAFQLELKRLLSYHQQ